MDETHVINQVKEDVCYVSQDFYRGENGNVSTLFRELQIHITLLLISHWPEFILLTMSSSDGHWRI